nr:formimidoylglutamase [Neofamilia massiliensis]
MMIKNYKVQNMKFWEGRVDSESDYDSFRWHQVVKPLDLNDENLKTFDGKLAFCFIGFESDLGIKKNKGRLGAAMGPEAIRHELANKPCNFSKDLGLFDAGNVSADGLSLDEAQGILASCVERLLELNYFPIVLGGGHETTFGHYKGVFSYLNKREDKPNIAIVNFDAHFDNRPYKDQGPSSGTMFRQIHDLNLENDLTYNYMVMGIQKSSNTVSLFKYADETKTQYVLAREIANGDLYPVFDRLDDFLIDMDHVYMTVCSDVFNSSNAPGVSAPQPFGLNPELVVKLIKYVLNSGKTISFDICEVSPRFDQDNTTASVAAVVIFTVVTKLAARVHR